MTTDNELNRDLINAILSAPDGDIKLAAEAGSAVIRTHLREEGFMRSIFNVVPVTAADLDKSEKHDRPQIIDDIEPNSKGAYNINFDGSPETRYFEGTKFVTGFSDITTPEFTKNTDQLMTYGYDIRKIITQDSLLSIQEREDSNFLAEVDAICGAAGSTSVYSGAVQHSLIPGPMGRVSLVDISNTLKKFQLPCGTVLMNEITFSQLLKEGRETVGGDGAQENYYGGIDTLKKRNILGLKTLTTLKRYLVPDNVIYVFAPQEYLGVFYELHKPTMYVEKKVKTLRFHTRETIGSTIANVLGVHKVTLDLGS